MRPFQLLDDGSERLQGGHVAAAQVVLQLLLYVLDLPQVLALPLGGGREDGGQQLFDGLHLLVLAVVLLDESLVVAGEPVNAVGVAQFGDGLGEHLLVVDASAHVNRPRHLYAEVAARTVARGQRRQVVGGGDERAETGRHRVLV